MDTHTPILASVIAVLSLILSIYTLYITRRKASKEIRTRFIERIVDKRIAVYPELWNITSMIYRKSEAVKERSFTKEWSENFLRKLWDWYYTCGYGLFMNEDTKTAFFELQLALKEYDPLKGRDNVKNMVANLHKGLRADLKLEKRIGESTDI